MKKRSIEFEISVTYVLILGVILIAYRVFLFVGFSRTLYNERNNELRLKTQEINRLINEYGNVSGAQPRDLSAKGNRSFVSLEEDYYADSIQSAFSKVLSNVAQNLHLTDDYVCILSVNGRLIAKSDNCKYNLPFFSAEELKKLKNNELVYKNVRIRNQNLRLASASFSYAARERYIIQVATPIGDIVSILRKRLYNSFIAIPIILLIAHLLARFLVVRILKPVVNIARTARNISLKNLNARVNTERLEEEMKYLADSFNEMIARLERSFEYVKEFSSSIGHELKTPLAIIKGEAEVALRKERQIADYQKALKVNIEEANRMIHIIDDLLFLTKLDYNPGNIKKERFDFIQFFREIGTRAAMLASHKNITLNAQLPQILISIEGNKLHLSRMFFNIIQNAIKFTPAGGRIDIMVESAQDKIRVAITDNGPGISDKDLPKIFQRFFHTDKYTSESKEGLGLGLGIAKSIAEFHNGNIEVRSKLSEGSTFTVSLPIIHL